MGIIETAKVFYQAEGRKKLNYYPEVYNFFDLYFKKYAQGITQQRTNKTVFNR
jgi:hypothetical protein